jgi:hypothetical protein
MRSLCDARRRRSRVSRTDRQCDSTIESTSCRTSRRPLKLNKNKVLKKWHCALIGHSSCRRASGSNQVLEVPPGVTCLRLLALLQMSRCMKFSRTQPHSSTLLAQKKGNGQNVRVPPCWSEREETASRNVLCLGIGGGLY